MIELDDEALVRRAQGSADAREALDTLCQRHYARVLAWCQRLTHNEQDAMDVAQDVFVRLEESLATFRMGSRFTTWLYVVVRRAAIDSLRRDRRRQRLGDSLTAEPQATVATPEIEAAQAQSDDAVRATVLSLLDPQEAQVFYMHYAMGMTLPAISEKLKLTNASGAKAPLVSAMRKLRRHYKANPGQDRRTP